MDVRKKRKLVVWLVVGLLVLSYFIVAYVQQQIRLNELAATQMELEAQCEELRLRKLALQLDLSFADTDAYKERIAREVLSFVKKDEIRFVSADVPELPSGGQAPAADPENPIQTP